MKTGITSCIQTLVATMMVLLCPLMSNVLAEELPVSSERENSLSAGTWSLQFQIEEDVGLQPFNGMIISMKRHLSRRSAFRIGLDLDIAYDEENAKRVTEYADTISYIDDVTTKSNGQSIELDFMYVRYPNPGASINMFWGVGPLVQFSRSRTESESNRINMVDAYKATVDSYRRSWGIGIMGAAGVEWFAAKSISFHAEYRGSFMYLNSDNEYTRRIYEEQARTSEDSVDGEEWKFRGLSVIMGISLYF